MMDQLKITPQVMLQFYRSQPMNADQREMLANFRSMSDADKQELLFHMLMLIAMDVKKLQASADPFNGLFQQLKAKQ